MGDDETTRERFLMYKQAPDGADVLVLSFCVCDICSSLQLMVSTPYNNVVVQVWDGIRTARGRQVGGLMAWAWAWAWAWARVLA